MFYLRFGIFLIKKNQNIGSVCLLFFHVFPLYQREVFMNLGLLGGLIIPELRDPK